QCTLAGPPYRDPRLRDHHENQRRREEAMTGAEMVTMLKKQPVGATCAVICVLCGALFYFRADKIAEETALLEAKTKEAQAIRTNLANAGSNLAQQVTELQQASQQVAARLARVGQVGLNQQFFYRLENDTGVKLVDI